MDCLLFFALRSAPRLAAIHPRPSNCRINWHMSFLCPHVATVFKSILPGPISCPDGADHPPQRAGRCPPTGGAFSPKGGGGPSTGGLSSPKLLGTDPIDSTKPSSSHSYQPHSPTPAAHHPRSTRPPRNKAIQLWPNISAYIKLYADLTIVVGSQYWSFGVVDGGVLDTVPSGNCQINLPSIT